MTDIKILSLREHAEMLETFIEYFTRHWHNPEVYRDCMTSALNSDSPLPQWFAAVTPEGKIIGGAGLITNDFISRMDLWPWLCALYVEEEYRNRGIAGQLIQAVTDKAKSAGFPVIYCATDHIGFYERYGFEFIGIGYHPWDDTSRIYKRKA